MLFKKASIKDFEALCLLRSQLAHAPEDKKTTEYARYNKKNDSIWIQKCLRSHRKIILVAEDTEGICAHAILLVETVSPKMQAYYTYRKKAILVHLLVDENKRHQGIATDLLKYTFKYLKQQGVEFIDLDCYIGNKNAEKLYKKSGFKDVFVCKRFRLK